MTQIPRSRKEAKSLFRINSAKMQREQKRILFYKKLALRRGLPLEDTPCQEGFAQVVDKVIPAGHGFLYTSRACSGCAVGAKFITKNFSPQKSKCVRALPVEVLGCNKLQSTFLFSARKIEPLEVVVATKPQVRNEEPLE